MYRKQRRFITPVFLLGLLVLSFFSATIISSAPVYAADPYTAESNGGSCKSGDTPYDEAGAPGQPVKKMCRPAEKAVDDNRQGDTGQDNTDEVTCAIEKIGWILCPVIETAGWASDKLFYFLANNLLEIEPELFNVTAGGSKAATVTNSDGSTTQTQTTKQNGTYQAWGLAKDLANVAFIAAFVVIVISQVTSYGISNYGIKRMLPRLIVAAIAVNVSYFICQGVVDLSNILGYNLHKALVDIAAQVGPSPFAGGAGSGGEFESSDGIMGKIAMLVLATAGIVWILMGPLAAMLLFVIITVVTITLILLMRKAFIVLLVVASPLAFVAYLLPNTEQYFQKWWGMFWKLLLVFPIVALLMGGGQLASAIILSAGATTATEVKSSCKSGSGTTSKSLNKGNECEGTVEVANGGKRVNVSWSLGLIATGVAVAPLLAVWSVLQGALSAAGAIGGKIGASINKVQDRQKGSLQKAGQERRKYLGNKIQTGAMAGKGVGKFVNYATLGGARRAGTRKAKYRDAEEELGAAQQAYNDAARRGGRGTPEDARKALTNRKNALNQKQENDAVSAIQYANREATTDELKDQLKAASDVGDKVQMRAIAEALEKHGSAGADAIADAISHADSTGNTKNIQAFRDVIRTSTNLKGSRADVDKWATSGAGDLSYHGSMASTYAGLSDAQLASQTTKSFSQTGATIALGQEVAMTDADGNVFKTNRANRLVNKEMSGANSVENAKWTR